MESIAPSSVRPRTIQRLDFDEKVDLLHTWQVIWSSKWSILSLVLVAMLATVVVLFGITPTYRAITTLLIEQQKANIVAIEQIYGTESSQSEYLQTQFELLKSRTLAEQVVRKLNLTTHPEFDPRQKPKPLINVSALLSPFLKAKPAAQPGELPGTVPDVLAGSVPTEEARIFKDVTSAFMDRIVIEPIPKSQLVKIQVDMADAPMAARAANALANGYIEAQLEASMAMSANATAWMHTRLGELRDKLTESENRLQAYREAENLVDLDGVTTINAAELSLTGNRMIDARRQRAEAESQYRQVQSMREGGWEKLATIPAVLGNPLIQQFKAEEARARAKVEELSKRYGSRHPAMEAARTELNAASASLRGQVEQIVAGIERNYQLALANEGSLKNSYNANKTQIQNISRKEFQVRELQREVEANRALYETFMTRLKETTATSDLETANARVIDPATVPSRPIKPQKGLIVVLVGILALLAGAGISLLLNSLNDTFKSTEDVENNLNLPVLGILPMIKKQERGQLAKLFTSHEHRTFAESIRTIRTAVILSGMNSSHHEILVVTSSIPGEGKSTVAANLALALGQMEKVLLIDADLRRPTLAKNYDFPVGTPGLANLIANTARLEDCIRHSNGIDMLSAGAVPPNPLELLSSPRFSSVLETLKKKYDRIVIDSPPTQAVSDAAILATQANALIYVIKSESTPIPLVQKGVGQMLQNNAPITGVVLNQVNVKKAKKYMNKYGGYYDYYGYSSDDKKATGT